MSDCTIVYDDPFGAASPGDVREAVYEAAGAGVPYDEETHIGVAINRGLGQVRVSIPDAADADDWSEDGYLALRDALAGVEDLGGVISQDGAPYQPQRYEAAESESETEADEDGADIEADAEAELAIDPDEHTVPELKEAIEDVTDVDALEAALEAETEGEDRTTAKRALRGRINTLTEDDGA